MLPGIVTQRNDNANGPRFLDAQIARHDVGSEIMFAGQRLDAVPRLLADQARVRQCTRYCAGRYARNFCQIVDIPDSNLFVHVFFQKQAPRSVHVPPKWGKGN